MVVSPRRETVWIVGAITLTSALFVDIFFLPALLSRFAKPPGNESLV